MQRRMEIAILGILVVVLAFVYFHRDSGDAAGGALSSNVGFTPLDVQEPQLRLDLLAKIQKSVYTGTHRNVFVFGPAPVAVAVMTPAQQRAEERSRFVGPVKTPPAPLNIPVQFFGMASMPDSGRRVAFFQSGEDVMVVPEGDSFLNRFRLVHIGNESAEVVEISSGRHADVPMVPPVDQSAGQSASANPQPQEVDPNQ